MDEQDLAVTWTTKEVWGLSFKIAHTVSQGCLEKKYLQMGGNPLSGHYHGNNLTVYQ